MRDDRRCFCGKGARGGEKGGDGEGKGSEGGGEQKKLSPIKLLTMQISEVFIFGPT